MFYIVAKSDFVTLKSIVDPAMNCRTSGARLPDKMPAMQATVLPGKLKKVDESTVCFKNALKVEFPDDFKS